MEPFRSGLNAAGTYVGMFSVFYAASGGSDYIRHIYLGHLRCVVRSHERNREVLKQVPEMGPIFLLRNAGDLLFQGAVNEFNLPLAAGGLFSDDACRPS